MGTTLCHLVATMSLSMPSFLLSCLVLLHRVHLWVTQMYWCTVLSDVYCWPPNQNSNSTRIKRLFISLRELPNTINICYMNGVQMAFIPFPWSPWGHKFRKIAFLIPWNVVNIWNPYVYKTEKKNLLWGGNVHQALYAAPPLCWIASQVDRIPAPYT